MRIAELETPALLLDHAKLERNVARMRARVRALGVSFRPHLKTSKCVEVARLLFDGGTGPVTVSTLKEAEFFARHGFRDVLYAVGITPAKLARAAERRARGTDLRLLLDERSSAEAAARLARELGAPLPTLIEIDSDDHRAGVPPEAPELLEIGRVLGPSLAGVMTHAGASYACRSLAAIRAMAEQERARTVRAAERLRAAGLACPVVSVGSTPTALCAERLDGVSEVRAGVYVFFDLVMAGLEVCTLDDVALSVLATVIGRRPDKGWLITDAGWMALSRDRGTAEHAHDRGYGEVCDESGVPLGDVVVTDANQEHGIVSHRSDPARTPMLPVGTRLRILPNHACATAAQHERYHVLRGGSVEALWPRFNGW